MATHQAPERRPLRAGGAALVVLLVAAGLLAAVIVVSVFGTARSPDARERATREALARAKEALLTYAVTYAERRRDPTANYFPVAGYLPCPDQGPATWDFGNEREGVANQACGDQDVSQIGRLPWHTLDIEPLRDGDGECLWYVVSGNFKNNPKTSGMLNWDTPGLLRVGVPNVAAGAGLHWLAGNTASDRAVAVIIAPGRALHPQDRAQVAGTPLCGGNYNPANYLDSQHGLNNAYVVPAENTVSSYVAGTPREDFNDRVAYITAGELFDRISRHEAFRARIRSLTGHVARCIAEYGKPAAGNQTDFRVPWAAPVSLTDYVGYTYYTDGDNNEMGRVPHSLTHSADWTGRPEGVLLAAPATGRCDASYWTAETAEWYKNWKDQLFLAVSHRFEPNKAPGASTCPSNECVRVSGNAYLGVVIFAGRALPGQNRGTQAQKGIVGNYLEGLNLSSFPNAMGNGTFESGSAPNAAFTSTGPVNDLLYCISPGVPKATVAPC